MSIELREVIPEFVFPDLTSRSPTQGERSACGAADGSSPAASRYHHAVEQVILAMRQRLNEPMSLRAMAGIALLSPYYFNRVFRLVTGITPCRFLTTLRIEAAKRLLITTRSSVSDVCFGVGYHSMGSFTREFTRLVGLPPTSLRRLAQDTPMYFLERLRDHEADPCHGAPPGGGLVGQISGPDGFSGFIFVGLFATPIPQGRPVGCALLSSPGPYRIAGVPDGAYHLFAAAFPRSGEPLAYLLPDQSKMYVGASQDRLLIDGDTVEGQANVTLRPLRLTDPPILVALPLLMVEYSSTHEMVMA